MKDGLTAAQVAERLEVGRSTVNLWCRQGRFKGAHVEESPVGSYWLIPEAALAGFVKPKRGPAPKAKPEQPARGSSRKKADAKPGS